MAALAAVAGTVLQILTRDVPIEYYGVRGFQGFFGLIFATTGWLIATRHHRNPIGWIFLGVGAVSTLQNVSSGYATYSIARHGGDLPLTDFTVWTSVWVWVLVVGPMATHVLLLFPQGRLETTRQKFIAVYAAVAQIILAAGVAITPGQAGETPAGVVNPYALSKDIADTVGAVGYLLFLSALLLSLGVAVLRFRRATGEVRQQMKWLLFAGSIAVLTLSLSLITEGTAGNAQEAAGRAVAILVIISMTAIPLAAGLAILRYGLYEIDVVINKAIVYGMLAVFITLVYIAVVVGVGALVGSGANTLLTVAATAIIAIAAQPVRVKAARVANRLVFGRRASPYEALSEFSARLSQGLGTDESIPHLARLMTEATAADRASVWLVSGAHFQQIARWPTAPPLEPIPYDDAVPDIPDAEQVYPVRHEGELLGALAVSAPANDPLQPTEDRLLSDLASQAGLLLRNARLFADLLASRQRLVAAQDQERRRIERDLHDGAQQHLVALSVGLGVLRTVVSDPQSHEMIDNLKASATEAIENLRDLARGIYPPLLAQTGLVAALTAQAAKAALPVTIEGEVGRHAQAVEVALYFCALEALQNTAKYARATRATVRVFEEPGILGFEASDDGAGFDARTVKRGSGLTNMADRLEALGGTLEITARPGAGTTVKGWVASAPASPSVSS